MRSVAEALEAGDDDAARVMVLTTGLSGAAAERQMFFPFFSMIDKLESVAAFLEKRKPEWKAG